MIRLLIFSFFLIYCLACKEKVDKPTSNGSATVLVNQELWNIDVFILERDSSVGWDIVELTEFWPDGAVKKTFNFLLEFDLLLSQSSHPLTTNTIPLPTIELDSIHTLFSYKFPEGDASAAIYRVSYPTDLSNEISFEFEENDPKFVTAKWSAELVLDENWRDSAESEGHPDTIRMENGTATFRLP